MDKLFAQNLNIFPGDTNYGPTPTLGGATPTPIVIKGPLKDNLNSIGDVVSVVVEFLYPIAAILLLVYLLWTGFSFMTAGGDPEKIKNAKARATAALIGFILLISAFLITRLFAMIFGLGENLFDN